MSAPEHRTGAGRDPGFAHGPMVVTRGTTSRLADAFTFEPSPPEAFEADAERLLERGYRWKGQRSWERSRCLVVRL